MIEPNILLGVFYRHPNKKETKFTDSLLATLKKIRKENKKIIIIIINNSFFMSYVILI